MYQNRLPDRISVEWTTNIKKNKEENEEETNKNLIMIYI